MSERRTGLRLVWTNEAKERPRGVTVQTKDGPRRLSPRQVEALAELFARRVDRMGR